MRYSLLSRFRGTLLGTALGEIYGSQYKQQTRLESPPEPGESVELNSLCPWSQIALLCAQSLIRCGRLDVEDWLHNLSRLQPSFLSSKIGAASGSEAAVATLPVALFFHENEATLLRELTLASAAWQGTQNTPIEVLAVGYAIALALTEKLNVATLIPQTLAYLQDSETPIGQQLAQIQTLLEQAAPLEQAVTQLCREHQPSTTPIALAFYCFLSTPEDFRLSLTRAMQTGYEPQTTAAITGALSGVYNSLIGIPLGWRLAFNRNNSGEMLQMADQLLRVWSGVYDPTTAHSCHLTTVAAPRVIQQRHGGL